MADAPGEGSRRHGLSRDLRLLDVLALHEAEHGRGLGVVELAARSGREKSQVSRALKALAEEGVVERDPDTMEYRLGWRLLSLVARTAENRLVRVATPVMRRLAAEIEETCHLCVLRDSEVLTLLSVSSHDFRAHGWEGKGVPAARTSAGRVLLLDATPDELYVRLGMDDLSGGFDGSLVHSVQELWQRVQEARQRGFAEVREEFESDLVGVSAPIRDFRGRVVAALNVGAPADRLAARLETTGRITVGAADRVSAALGWERRRGRRGR
ncbi:Transcriptional regulator KdgR [Streptomyces sp. YIM 130001]|uniref:IclR family transcriptional regulator n=1 Tax=Streptomyces sp. YIM 130001 TaxID=2259644 RepID=UPI000E65E3B3|nr:IclR family transcriptional regulator [Streptomyces sp. YIM 130001]RII22137.1 Transcriptional regulator KdgR [Streptomyces sp. YIM 130001]